MLVNIPAPWSIWGIWYSSDVPKLPTFLGMVTVSHASNWSKPIMGGSRPNKLGPNLARNRKKWSNFCGWQACKHMYISLFVYLATRVCYRPCLFLPCLEHPCVDWYQIGFPVAATSFPHLSPREPQSSWNTSAPPWARTIHWSPAIYTQYNHGGIIIVWWALTMQQHSAERTGRNIKPPCCTWHPLYESWTTNRLPKTLCFHATGNSKRQCKHPIGILVGLYWFTTWKLLKCCLPSLQRRRGATR